MFPATDDNPTPTLLTPVVLDFLLKLTQAPSLPPEVNDKAVDALRAVCDLIRVRADEEAGAAKGVAELDRMAAAAGQLVDRSKRKARRADANLAASSST